MVTKQIKDHVLIVCNMASLIPNLYALSHLVRHILPCWTAVFLRRALQLMWRWRNVLAAVCCAPKALWSRTSKPPTWWTTWSAMASWAMMKKRWCSARSVVLFKMLFYFYKKRIQVKFPYFCFSRPLEESRPPPYWRCCWGKTTGHTSPSTTHWSERVTEI